jgi:putative membrane protein
MKRIGWLVLIGGGLLIVLLLASSLLSPFVSSRGLGGYRYGWGMMGGFGLPMMGMMGLGMILFWVFILGGVVWLVQTLARGTGNRSISPQGESAFDILRRRYSRGEITKEQFDGMKRDLGI